MSRSKEDILSLLKSSVLILRDKPEEFGSNAKLKEKWEAEQVMINDGVAQLSPEDLAWLNKEYLGWSKRELTEPIKTFLSNGLPKSK